VGVRVAPGVQVADGITVGKATVDVPVGADGPDGWEKGGDVSPRDGAATHEPRVARTAENRATRITKGGRRFRA
jgi:hypothetical protein